MKCENGHKLKGDNVVNVMELYIGLIQMKDILYAKDAIKLEKLLMIQFAQDVEQELYVMLNGQKDISLK